MKKLKMALMITLTLGLVGCFGHGYEGTYEKKVGSDEKIVNAIAGLAGSEKVIIGRDFIETNGVREKFNKIFVRKTADESFLIFENGAKEKAWKIINPTTLVQGGSLVNVQLVKIETPNE